MRLLMLTDPTMTGEDVRQWQKFLVSRGIKLNPDGDFGTLTHKATRLWQYRAGLKYDGEVGPLTIAAARKYGFAGDKVDVSKPVFVKPTVEQVTPSSDPKWPYKPNFSYLTDDKRGALFGTFKFSPPPGSASAGGNVTILGDWEEKNITKVFIPQLKGVPFYDEDGKTKCSGNITFHKKAADQLKALFDAWEKADLLDLILTYEGSYVPRYIRGSKRNLSNHSWGTAFDINANWNGLGKTPAALGAKGSVRELVPLAHKYGFYWGGHFSRGDGMHFEVAFIL